MPQVVSIEKMEDTSLLPNPIIVSVRSKVAFQFIELQDRDSLVERLLAQLQQAHRCGPQEEGVVGPRSGLRGRNPFPPPRGHCSAKGMRWWPRWAARTRCQRGWVSGPAWSRLRHTGILRR